MFLRICDTLTKSTQHTWILTHRNNSEIFDSLSELESFDVVIWSNTSGDDGLTSAQRSNYEAYVAGGGNYLGIHAASDTYRHSTANGGSTGSWDFYAEHLSGCSVQQSPNHTRSNHNNLMDHEEVHPILEDLPDPWNKTEEYYYWENGYIDSSFNALLTVRVTGGNSYDSSRMMAQYKELPSGSRSFYTALGHARSNFTDPNNEFEILNRNALYWVVDPKMTTNVDQSFEAQISLYPNPAKEVLYMEGITPLATSYQMYDVLGRLVQKGIMMDHQIRLNDLGKGLYFITFQHQGKVVQKAFEVVK